MASAPSDPEAPGSLRLRAYAEADWAAVCHVHDASRPLELERGGVDPVAAMRPMRDVAERDAFHDSETLVAELDGDLVGFVSWWDDFVTWLYVHPDHERRGVGRALATAAVERIGDQAWTMALESNAPSVGLFASLGLGVVKRWRGDCEGVPCDSVRLARATSRMADPAAEVR